MVLPLRWEELVEADGVDLQVVFNSMTKQIQSLLAQRDTHHQVHMEEFDTLEYLLNCFLANS